MTTIRARLIYIFHYFLLIDYILIFALSKRQAKFIIFITLGMPLRLIVLMDNRYAVFRISSLLALRVNSL